MNEQARIVEVTEPTEIAAIREDCTLAAPYLMESNGHVYCDAEELRAWRSARSTPGPHAHEGSVSIDRGETCIRCGKDMHDPVHDSQSTSDGERR